MPPTISTLKSLDRVDENNHLLSGCGSNHLKVVSPQVKYEKDAIYSKYRYATTEVIRKAEQLIVIPREFQCEIKTKTKVPKTGVMLVGWGGNNGSTVTAAILANQLGLQWNTKQGPRKADYVGSLTQASTLLLGQDKEGRSVHVPFHQVLPMVNPSHIVLDGWDISSLNLADSMKRAQVLDWDLQTQLHAHMEPLTPRPSVYYSDFIAANQRSRADNLIPGSKQDHLDQIRADIRDFKKKNDLDRVFLLWTANTERFSDIIPGVHDSANHLLAAIKAGHSEISPSVIFATASILEGCAYINGSPQNTMNPGVMELARKHSVHIAGDDFKSGQTKVKSVMVDFLVSAGIKPVSIVSYNHLGNNDGKNLSSREQFRSKEISKSNVIDDMVASNSILYKPGEQPDHLVEIKYVPHVGDSKRAMDEYTSEIMMGGTSTIVMHNTCEDSLLAAPIILDLIILAELCERISIKVEGDDEFQPFHSVLSILSYLCKAPLVPRNTQVVNSLFQQRACIENIFRACVGLSPNNHMGLQLQANFHEDKACKLDL